MHTFQNIEHYTHQKDPIDFIISYHHARALGHPLIAAIEKLLLPASPHRLWVESETLLFRAQLQRHSFMNIIDILP
ncbi:MAG: hypothetical protein H6925_03155 [Holosporaceae bacterium]|nr:MAG: hypothetical protein H6925_03155 [Holosporaceae bacterium]